MKEIKMKNLQNKPNKHIELSYSGGLYIVQEKVPYKPNEWIFIEFVSRKEAEKHIAKRLAS